jgi:hypothetical protein
MAEAPIQTVFGNLVFARDASDAWAVFRLRCRSYRSEPRRKQRALVDGLEAFCEAVKADFQILRVFRTWDAADYVRELQARTPRRARVDLWRAYLESQREQLDRLDCWTPAVFVCVRLAAPQTDLHGRAARLFERTPREAWRALRERLRTRGARSLDLDRLAVIGEGTRVATERVKSCLDAEPARADEVQWLIRRAFCRGLGEPKIAALDLPQALSYPDDARPVIVPQEGNVLRWLGEDGVERHHRYVKALSELGESYQAGLCLGEMGHTWPFTRAAEVMFSPVEEHGPIDACLNVRWIANDQALRRVSHQVARTDNQLRDEEQSAHGALDEGYRRAELAREAHARFSQTGEPLLLGTLSLICSATSLDELNQRVRGVRESFPHPLYRPLGDQLELFLQHLPCQRTRTLGYERAFTCEQVGAMVPHATHEAGSSTGRGLYFAYTIHGHQPVLMDLREASLTDKPPTIALNGTLGGGKTMALQLLEYQAFVQGARIVDIDPKGDHRFHLLPEVAPHAQVIVLGPDPEHAGKLDPLRVAPASERHQAAASFLLDVLPPGVEVRVESAINGAIGRVIEKHREWACCMEVIAELEAGERAEEQEAGYLLRQYCTAGLVQLGFANLDDPLPAQAAEQVTYLQIRALKRGHVQTVRSELSQAQRHGRAVLQLVALYAMRILGEERDRLKVLSFDEASFLTQDAVGQQLLDTLVRWGRSELGVPILSTQQLGDIADQDNLIGHWFLFGMRSREHATRGLELLDLDTDDTQLLESLTERFGRGRALYRDLHHRCEEIQLNPDPRLLDLLKTTPEDERTFSLDDDQEGDADELAA